MRRTHVITLIALVLGLCIGFAAGVFYIERRWSQPVQLLRGARSPGADPVPPDGTRGLRPMPFARSRVAAAEFTRRDPVQVTVGSVGRSEGEMFLHVTLRNQGRCQATAVAGVAYGFDAFGRPARMNRGGEHFVAFASEALTLEPGASTLTEFPLHHPDVASLVLGQVDRVRCADGTVWTRGG